jgi:hypothetical protein
MRNFVYKKRLLILSIIIFLVAPIMAQTGSTTDISSTPITLPVLNNHRFVVNPYATSPFIKTYLRSSLGGGAALGLKVPIYVVDGEPLAGLRGDLTFLALEFEYQYAVNNWLAVFGNVGLVSRFGTEAQSLLAQGINASYGFELGWMFKLLETEKVVLSATANIWNQSGTVLNLYNFVQDIIDNGGLEPDNQLIYSRDYIQGGGGLRVAWAPSELIGVNGLAEFLFGEALDQKGTDIFYNIAGSIDLDLNKVWSVPIGFAAGFTVNTFYSSSDSSVDDNTTTIFLRTSYTGRNDFLISLDMTWNRLPISNPKQTLNASTVLIGVEYYF